MCHVLQVQNKELLTSTTRIYLLVIVLIRNVTNQIAPEKNLFLHFTLYQTRVTSYVIIHVLSDIKIGDVV